MLDVLRINVSALEKLHIPNDLEKLIKQWERSQRENSGDSYKRDPLAEYERLFKLWERAQNKIRQTQFTLEKEKEFQEFDKKV